MSNSEASRKRILVVIDYFSPGFKAGGPLRTVSNMLEWLGNDFQFMVAALDRDLGDKESFPDVIRDSWQSVGKASVYYLSPGQKRVFSWLNILRSLDYEVLYLNSFFSRLSIKSILFHWLRWIPTRPLILAPRGEFSLGALSLKRLKKKVYIQIVKWLGLYNKVIWQASSEYERKDIIRVFGQVANGGNPAILASLNLMPRSVIHLAPDLPPIQFKSSIPGSAAVKKAGEANIVFISRISRKKNLDYALKLLSGVDGKVRFDLYGPLEDRGYWRECEEIIRGLPERVQVQYKGSLTPDQVPESFARYHLFFFPTRGENFGHVILESLRSGCPVLISDQTPWRGLDGKKAGWVLPLSKPEAFQSALNNLIAMDDVTFQDWSQSARKYGEDFAADPGLVEANRQLFCSALSKI